MYTILFPHERNGVGGAEINKADSRAGQCVKLLIYILSWLAMNGRAQTSSNTLSLLYKKEYA